MATVGSGKYTYEYVPNWAKMPANQLMGTASAVATDSQDRVYIFQRTNPPVLVFDREGNFLNSWGDGMFDDRKVLAVLLEDRLLMKCLA